MQLSVCLVGLRDIKHLLFSTASGVLIYFSELGSYI